MPFLVILAALVTSAFAWALRAINGIGRAVADAYNAGGAQ